MAQEGERSYVLGRLILDYIRTFMWPGVVLLAVVIYQEDLMGILKGREFKAFGVEVGPAVEQIQQVEATTQQELADIAALVETLQASYERELAAVRDEIQTGDGQSAEPPAQSEAVTRVAEDIDLKINSLRENLDREVQQIQQTATRAPLPQQQQIEPTQQQPTAAPAEPAPTTRGEQAAAFERAGFEAILDRDFEAALEAFSEARRTWSTYHNVAEIQRHLAKLKKKGTPIDEAKWAAIDRAILTEFSWGMPPDLRERFRVRVDDAYAVGASQG